MFAPSKYLVIALVAENENSLVITTVNFIISAHSEKAVNAMTTSIMADAGYHDIRYIDVGKLSKEEVRIYLKSKESWEETEERHS
ncbi:MAG: hypothetical protein EKK63_01765 [Acinetobacter sp.]|uniref:hypothetical protein n=1 Tax=Acinetobacter sp. TaxID=472 RepID=UPI000FBFB44E|nr:hypothetical protein [Acinetobacter sp.]RUP42332.1 MAG: hypothetical protein EKK63_01765 [Acinetobacter sp.]